MKLVNGNGQLGSYLKELSHLYDKIDVNIYHTWNVADKSQEVQKQEYEKFVTFVNNTVGRIAFISTKSENDTWYTWYKQKAEAYLLLHNKDCMILRLPTFIGTPCKIFEPEPTAWGNVELISIENAAREILKYCKNYNGLNRIYNIKGEIISAQLVVDILKRKKL
jgi:nucleoside-diphosphate-sugar epimerase